MKKENLEDKKIEATVLKYADKFYPKDTEDFEARHRAISMATQILVALKIIKYDN